MNKDIALCTNTSTKRVRKTERRENKMRRSQHNDVVFTKKKMSVLNIFLFVVVIPHKRKSRIGNANIAFYISALNLNGWAANMVY